MKVITALGHQFNVSDEQAKVWDKAIGKSSSNLIDAAPDLLAALQAVMQYCVTVSGVPDRDRGRTEEQQYALDMARAAIAKAVQP